MTPRPFDEAQDRTLDQAEDRTRGCHIQTSGSVDLYFYDDLPLAEREAIARHLSECADCRQALEELAVIREALAARPDVSAPRGGDWSALMARLRAGVGREGKPAAVGGEARPAAPAVVAFTPAPARRSYAGYFAMAALLALVTMSVLVLVRSRSGGVPASPAPVVADTAAVGAPQTRDAAFAAISEQHFERSKLVVLGLATKDAQATSSADWTYERELASTLLSDTRLYRVTAEDRGLDRLAGVMRDLELVLLQTSLTDETDPGALPQIQRLIRKRDLLEKMDVVSMRGT